MQLNERMPAASIRSALAAAGAALLAPALPAAAQGSAVWKGEGALLLYKEGGGRVSAVEPVVSVRRTDGNDQTLGLKVTLDTLTGASPNGAVPQPTPQTFTSPSGGSSYTVDGGELPLDPSFRDQRTALAFSVERPLGNGLRASAGANVSHEYDFDSIGANGALAWDFNDRNTTLSLGLAYESDRIKAVGSAPQGLRPAYAADTPRAASLSRNVADVLIGVTQVMSRRWLMQANLGIGRGSGYHSDPYKVLSVVDGGTGLLAGTRYVTEQRPDTRLRTSLYWQNKVMLKDDVLDVAYRFYRDDWGVRAHTLDLRYRVEIGAGVHVEPQLRTYRQTAADFWRGWLVDGRDWNSGTQSTPLAAASADPRLAAFHALTLGLKLGVPVGPASEFSLRVARYRQTQRKPADAPGVLSALDLAPDLKATTAVVGFTRDF